MKKKQLLSDPPTDVVEVTEAEEWAIKTVAFMPSFR